MDAALGTIAALLAIAGAVTLWIRRAHKAGTSLAGRWLAKHIAPVVAPVVAREVRPLIEQWNPNSGSSAFDKLTRLDQWRIDADKRFTGLDETVGEVRDMMVRHLEVHATPARPAPRRRKATVK